MTVRILEFRLWFGTRIGIWRFDLRVDAGVGAALCADPAEVRGQDSGGMFGVEALG